MVQGRRRFFFLKHLSFLNDGLFSQCSSVRGGGVFPLASRGCRELVHFVSFWLLRGERLVACNVAEFLWSGGESGPRTVYQTICLFISCKAGTPGPPLVCGSSILWYHSESILVCQTRHPSIHCEIDQTKRNRRKLPFETHTNN